MLSPAILVSLALSLQGSYGKIFDLNSDGLRTKEILRKSKFDYIIVGGGTAGLTAASRLTESDSRSVLVIEAGGSGLGNDLVTIPGRSYQFLGTEIDWGYTISPQKHANNQEINLSMGKVLGGNTAVNGLVWVRGTKPEYDAFEELGNPGWNWENVLRLMKKSEKLNPPSTELAKEKGYTVNPASHGSTGPVDVSFPPFLPTHYSSLVKAAVELGHNFNSDPYSGNNTGVTFSLSSQTTVPVRESSEFAYITPYVNRSNLVIFTHALASKIHLKPFGKAQQATGVNIIFPDGSEAVASVTPKGEVILSAGVVRTPQLLELSGIGSRAILQPLDIPVKVDLPGVGENFQDHTITVLAYQLKDGLLSNDALSYIPGLLEEQQQLYKKGKGFLTFAQAVVDFEPAGTVLSPAELVEAKKILSQKPPTISQEHFESIRRRILNGGTQVEYLMFNSGSGFAPPGNVSYVTAAITHLHPLSRGSIHINTTSINDHPKIDPNIFESEWDTWFLAKASAYARRYFSTRAMKQVVEPNEVFPGNGTQSHGQWIKHVKETVNAGYHSIGTASLLPREKNGVVDPNLKVYGTTNLRVADASVLPLHVSAHTQTTAYAVGEKLAEILAA